MVLVWVYRAPYKQTREYYFSGWPSNTPCRYHQPESPWTEAAIDLSSKDLEIEKPKFENYMKEHCLHGHLVIRKKKNVMKKGKKG